MISRLTQFTCAPFPTEDSSGHLHLGMTPSKGTPMLSESGSSINNWMVCVPTPAKSLQATILFLKSSTPAPAGTNPVNPVRGEIGSRAQPVFGKSNTSRVINGILYFFAYLIFMVGKKSSVSYGDIGCQKRCYHRCHMWPAKPHRTLRLSATCRANDCFTIRQQRHKSQVSTIS